MKTVKVLYHEDQLFTVDGSTYNFCLVSSRGAQKYWSKKQGYSRYESVLLVLSIKELHIIFPNDHYDNFPHQ